MANIFENAYAKLDKDSGTPSENSYLVVPISPTLNNWFVGKDNWDQPCILVRSNTIKGRQPPAIKLENLDVQFHVPCKIEQSGGSKNQATCSVMRLKSKDIPTRDVFFSVCDSVASILGNTPSDVELSKAMRQLASIFRKLLEAPTRTIAGLFGEMVLIYRSLLPHEVIRSWRNAESDRFDFSTDDVKVEVKSTSSRRRVHEFSFEQSIPTVGTTGLAASIFVERAGKGTSIAQLQLAIEKMLAGKPDEIFKLRQIVAGTLGASQHRANEYQYDLNLASRSITFYDLKDIPAIRGNLPAGVSAVRFSSDLTRIDPINLERCADRNPSLTPFLQEIPSELL